MPNVSFGDWDGSSGPFKPAVRPARPPRGKGVVMLPDTRPEYVPRPEERTETAILPPGTTLAEALSELVELLPGLRDALRRQSGPPVDRMTLRLDEVAAALGVSRRVVERERSAGRFPRPDLTVGKMPLWRVETVRAYVERGGCS